MKCRFAGIALAAALGATAHADTVDLWQLLGDGNSTLPAGEVVYQLRDASGTSVNVALGFDQLSNSLRVQMTAFKFNGPLSPKELRLFSANVAKISEGCFNGDPSRASSITSWVLSNDAKEESFYYTAGIRLAKQAFGPLQMTLERRVNGKAHSLSVEMLRRGTPGQAPWLKTCVPSG